MPEKIYLLDRFARKRPIYSTWMDDCPYPCVVVDQMPSTWSAPEDAALVVTHQHYQWEYIAGLRRVMETGQTPVLILCDGVLEYRNSWENPGLAPGAIFQPLVGHKLACLGRAPARQLEALGNAGKCEIVGHPRFDRLANLPPVPTQTEGPFRLLVTTARTPAFTADQQAAVLEGLQQLARRLARGVTATGRPIEVIWRLPMSIVTSLGWDHDEMPSASETNPASLEDAIDMSDAVITTPSTVYLESVLRRRPTAILDFTNSPTYVPAAWTISAPVHIAPVIEQLANPPADKMLFQRINLHDQLEVQTDSRLRLYALIQAMVKAGHRARETSEPLWLPARILTDPQRGIAAVEDEFDARTLFPDSMAHQIDSESWLRQELAQAIARLEQLPQELHRKNNSLDMLERHVAEAESRIEAGLTREATLETMLAQQSESLLRKTEHIESLSASLEETVRSLRQAREQIRELSIAQHTRANQFRTVTTQIEQLIESMHDLSSLPTTSAAAADPRSLDSLVPQPDDTASSARRAA